MTLPFRTLAALSAMSALSCGTSPTAQPREPAPVVPVAAPEPPGEAEGSPEPEAATLALALVVDRSGSMTGLPMETTLEALRAAVDELERDDWLTLIAFDSRPFEVVAKRRVGDKLGIAEAIARIQPGGGTEILSALELGGTLLEGSELPKRRHVILMSDGMAPNDGLERVVGSVTATGASISTVALGANADATLLGRIAELGGGRFHQVEDPRELPAVFRDEVSRARGRRRP